MNSDPVVHAVDLHVSYGSFEAVRGVSFDVARGEVFGVVGPNGAGKTSTLKVLAGLLRPSAGLAAVCGFDAVGQRDEVRRRIGYMADFFGVYDYLTVREYLEFFGGMYGIAGADLAARIDAVITTVTLGVKRDAPIRTLSRGMKQRLYLARALVHEPPVLILDEPASGMDPRGRDDMVRTLREVAARGTTVLISSHILDELQDLCTVVAVMEAGRLVGTRALRRSDGGAADVRRFLLLTPEPDRARALSLAAASPQVAAAEPAAEGVWLDVRGGDEAVSAVVRQMVAGGIRVLLPAADSSDLKQIFMRMTKGELM